MKKTYTAPSLTTIQLDMEERILADTTRLGVAGDGDVINESNYGSRILSTSWTVSDDAEDDED